MIITAMIEIPQGSQHKYEYDVATGRIRLDRVLHSSMHYPVNYGFILETWADDQDPLDVLVFGSTAIDPGTELMVRVIGAFLMQDEHGPDAKIVGVADMDPRFRHIKAVHDLGPHRTRELRHFFQKYKTLQGIVTITGNFQDENVAIDLIRRCRERFLARQAREHEADD